MPEDRKEVIKQMLVDIIDRMEDSTSMQDLR
jgi:2-phospho-L-lactate guanylyltransferase (CobY/MobA/RfbA family)